MTYLEKLKQDHPDWDEDDIRKYADDECPSVDCPDGYEPLVNCYQCWIREIPETETTNEREENNMEATTTTPVTRKTKAQLLEEIADLKKELAQMERYKQYEKCATEFAALRRAFESEGFTHEESFEMMKLMVSNAAKMASH